MSGEPASTTVDREDVLAAVRDEPPGTPLTARELAGTLACSRRSAYDKLSALAERGDLATKKIGARARVWWRPVDGADLETTAATVPDRSDPPTTIADATRPLREADGPAEIGDVVVTTLADVIGLADAAVYRFDTAENVLVPVATSTAPPDGTDLATVSAGGESPVWTGFAEGEPRIVDETTDAALAGPRGDRFELVVPLGEHGVVVAASAERAGIEDARASVDLVATVAATALDAVERRRTLQEFEGRLAKREQRLERVTRAADALRAVDRALVRATTHEEVRAEVCGALTDDAGYRFAWIGRVDDGHDTLEPHARAGDGRDYLSAVSLANGDGPMEPATEAATTGSVAVASNVADGLRGASWRREAISRDLQSAGAVPITHGAVRYGVLAVYADESGVIGEFERSVFADLGATIGNAIDALEARERLLYDTVIELEFTIGGDTPCVLSSFAAETGGQVRFTGIVPETETRVHLFFTVVDPSVPAVAEAIEALPEVESSHLVTTRADQHLVEAVVDGPTVPSLLVEREASVRSLRVDEEVRLAVDLPATVDVRTFVEKFQDEYPSAEFLARRERDRPVQTRQGFRAALEERLTERQREVLATAYHGGLFASPRQSTAGDVAERLGVTQPTVTEHLQAAQAKLLDLVFADDAPLE